MNGYMRVANGGHNTGTEIVVMRQHSSGRQASPERVFNLYRNSSFTMVINCHLGFFRCQPMLESRALNLLLTFSDEVFNKVDPLDFTALLYLSERGYVKIDMGSGKVCAARTLAGRVLCSRRFGSHHAPPSREC